MRRLLVAACLSVVEFFGYRHRTTLARFGEGRRDALAGVLASAAEAGASRPLPRIGSPPNGLAPVEFAVAEFVTTSTVAGVRRCSCPLPRNDMWAP
jgi:hypothetical protein